MKYTIILLSLFFVSGFFNTLVAQDKPNGQKNENAIVNDKVANVDAVLNDPKLSPEEIELLKIAGQDNPAIIDKNLNDPKMDPSEIPDESSFGESNARAEPIVEREEVRLMETLVLANPVSGNNQPQGKKVANSNNFFSKGPNGQPIGEQPVKITNYKESKGPNTQPPAKKPDEK